MADKTAPQKEVQPVEEEEVTKSKAEETTPEEEAKSENGESTENKEPADKENGKDEEEEEEEEEEKPVDDETDKVCSVKRKSTSGDAIVETPTEGATPEKKAKLAETTEAESKNGAEVVA